MNVLSWNALVGYMLASGADDGGLRVWDLRSFREGGFVSQFNFHRWVVLCGWGVGARVLCGGCCVHAMSTTHCSYTFCVSLSISMHAHALGELQQHALISKARR